MGLILRPQSSGAIPGGVGEVELSGGVLTVGRGSDNDLVLPDPGRHLSKRHCVIEQRGGDYLLFDLSKNGTFLNYAEERLGEAPVPLDGGDVITLGPYELVVEIVADMPGATSIPPLDPLPEDPEPVAPGRRSTEEDDGLLGGFGGPEGEDAILALLDEPAPDRAGGAYGGTGEGPIEGSIGGPIGGSFGGSSGGSPGDDGDNEDPLLASARAPRGLFDDEREPDPLGPVEPDDAGAGGQAPQGYGLDNAYKPRGVSSKPLLPDDWDAEPSRVGHLPGREGDRGDERKGGRRSDRRGAASAPQPPEQPPEPLPEQPGVDPFERAPEEPAPRPRPRTERQARPAADRGPKGSPMGGPAGGAAGDPAERAPGGDAAARAFLEALGAERLGVPDADLSATMTRLGRAMRIMIEGLREVLIARARIRSEFRISQTSFRPSGNNPLKFSVSPEQAVEAMVRPTVSGYQPSDHAAGEALWDIRAHEIAVVTGMEAALKALMGRLDPNRLASRLEAEGRLGKGVLGGRKSQLWDAYVALYGEVAAEAEDDFDTVFARAFVKAYEEQVRALRAAAPDAMPDMGSRGSPFPLPEEEPR